MPRVVVLIPAYNEADRIADTVAAALAMPGIDDLVVIDDGSLDNTVDVAEEAGANTICLEENSGKGAALNVGVQEFEADIYLMIDADLGSCASETCRLLEPVLAGHADMSIAAMKAPQGHKGGFGFVMRLSRWAIRRLGGMIVTAPLSGQRAFRRELIEAIGGFEEGFGVETAMTIDALRNGFTIVEVPLPLTHRVTGRNLAGFMHRGRQFRDIVRVIRKRIEGRQTKSGREVREHDGGQ
ncbi:MAG: glycosyltransferase [Armatimonadetes bacterium]|jgi:glycosyltransferase involved in cell wall biosynthesis|nr:glycosyltransferase [Armatimonadota bacterium]